MVRICVQTYESFYILLYTVTFWNDLLNFSKIFMYELKDFCSNLFNSTYILGHRVGTSLPVQILQWRVSSQPWRNHWPLRCSWYPCQRYEIIILQDHCRVLVPSLFYEVKLVLHCTCVQEVVHVRGCTAGTDVSISPCAVLTMTAMAPRLEKFTLNHVYN